MRQLSLTSLLSLGLATALLMGCSDQPTATATQVPSVSVTGSASIMVAPDQFIIRAAAVEEGKDVKALSSLANQKTNQVIELATSLGIDKKDIKALSLQVTPQWNYQPSRHLTGYQARRDITITLGSMDNYATLLEGLIDIGITDIGQTQAQVSNSKELAIDALADAVENARIKAEKLATAANRKLGPALSINEQYSYSPAPVAMRSMVAQAADSAQFEPGQVNLRQDVSVTFELQ